MKKFLVAVLFALILPASLCGCFGGDGTDGIRSVLNYPISITAETGELAFEIELASPSNATAKMTAPKTLSGLELVKNGDNITASYKGMNVPLPEASAKKVFMLSDILDKIIASFADNSYVVENGSVSVPCGDGVCVIVYDADGMPTSAEINSGGRRTVYNLTVKMTPPDNDGVQSNSNNETEDNKSNAEKSGRSRYQYGKHQT